MNAATVAGVVVVTGIPLIDEALEAVALRE
jgi:hypothetical protein